MTNDIRIIEIKDSKNGISTEVVGFPATKKEAFSMAKRLAGKGAKFYTHGAQMYATYGYVGERQMEIVGA